MTSLVPPDKWWAFAGEAPQDIEGAIFGDGWWTAPNSEAGGGAEPGGYAALPEALRKAAPSLIVTDVDSTLINEEVIDELADLAGHRKQVAAITDRAMRGEIDFEESLYQRVALLRGMPEAALGRVSSSITLTPGTRELIDWVHSIGGKFGIVSGGFTQVVAPIAEQLGIDFVAAIELEVEDGLLTGRTAGPVVDAQAKVHALRTWAGDSLSTTVAVGDGANDIPMLETAGAGIAFCAKPAVKEAVGNFLSIRRLDAVAGLLGYDPTAN